MRFDDRVMAVAFICVAAFVIHQASGFPRLAGMAVGPGLFPIVLSVALAAASALLWFGARSHPVAGERTAPLVRIPAELRERGPVVRVSAVFGSCLLFTTLGQSLGFLVVGFLSLVSLLLAFGARPIAAIGIGGVTVLAVNLFLVHLMRIPLPLGVLRSFGGWI